MVSNNFTNCPSVSRQVSLYSTGFISLILNALLLILIRNRTTSIMSGYKKVLYAGCFIDIYSSVTQSLIQVRLTYENKIHIKSMDGILPQILYEWNLIEDRNLNYIAMWESSALFMSNIFASVPFLYRYLNVVWNHNRSNRKFWLFLGFLLLMSFISCFSQAISSTWHHNENIKIIYPTNKECVTNLPFFDGKYNSNDMALLIVTYLFIPFFGWRIFMFVKKKCKLSAKMIEIHRQINRTIIFQALIPSICAGMPFCLMMLYLIINLNNDQATRKDLFTTIAYEASALVPIINPIVAIIFINSYKQTIKNILNNIFFQIFASTTSSNVNTFSNTQPLSQKVFTI